MTSFDVTAAWRLYCSGEGRGAQKPWNTEPRCESSEARSTQLYLGSKAGSFGITGRAVGYPFQQTHTRSVGEHFLLLPHFFPLLFGLLNFFLFLTSPLLSLRCSLFSTLFVTLGLRVTITSAFPLQFYISLYSSSTIAVSFPDSLSYPAPILSPFLTLPSSVSF